MTTGRNCYQTAKSLRIGVMSKDEMLRRCNGYKLPGKEGR